MGRMGDVIIQSVACRYRRYLGGLVIAMSGTGMAAGASHVAGGVVEPVERACKSTTSCATGHRGESFASSIDAEDFFSRVVERYRNLEVYEDTVVVEQVTARTGELPVREQTELACEFGADGNVNVRSPGRQVRDSLGVGGLFETSPFLDAADSSYDLWLAPHLTLRAVEQPLASFRPGIEEGFTPVRAERVTLNQVSLIRLDLHAGDGLSGDTRARYELFIDPTTMLIVRVRGAQLLPDGANLLTDFDITPRRVVTSEGKDVLDAVNSVRSTT